MLANGWPMILLVLVVAYLFAMFFPALGGLLLIGAPLGIFAALAAATMRARNIRLTFTDEVIRVTSGKEGFATDREHVHSAVLVESFARRRIGIRTTDLILLDQQGRTALLLSGLLWPPALLERVLDILAVVPVERVEGRQSPDSLALRYPRILQRTDGSDRGRTRK